MVIYVYTFACMYVYIYIHIHLDLHICICMDVSAEVSQGPRFKGQAWAKLKVLADQTCSRIRSSEWST